MKGIIKLVKEKYFFILIPDTRQVFAHRSTWLSLTPPCIDDVVEFDQQQTREEEHRRVAKRKRNEYTLAILAAAMPAFSVSIRRF